MTRFGCLAGALEINNDVLTLFASVHDFGNDVDQRHARVDHSRLGFQWGRRHPGVSVHDTITKPATQDCRTRPISGPSQPTGAMAPAS